MKYTQNLSYIVGGDTYLLRSWPLFSTIQYAKKSTEKEMKTNLHHVCQISLFLWEFDQPEIIFWCIGGYEGKITGNSILVHWRI